MDPEKPGKKPKQGGGTRPRPSCRDCIIEKATFRVGSDSEELAFRTRTEAGGYRVAENTASLEIAAEPSIPGCPCTWDDRINVEFIRIHTGLANQTREQLFRTPQLVQTRRARISRLPDHLTIAGCKLTLNISRINQDLRNGAIGGAQFNLKAVPTRIVARVRCNGTWRKLLIEITD